MGNTRKNVLPGARSKHADNKKSDNRHEDPQFYKAGPEQPGYLTQPPPTLHAFPGVAFESRAHGSYFLQNDGTVFNDWKQVEPSTCVVPPFQFEILERECYEDSGYVLIRFGRAPFDLEPETPARRNCQLAHRDGHDLNKFRRNPRRKQSVRHAEEGN